MNISIKGTRLTLTPSVKKYANDKIGSLNKYIDVMEAKVELEREMKHKSGLVFRAEAMLIIGGKNMWAEARGEDIYAAIDMLTPKLKEQISKFKDKKTTVARSGARKAKGK
jgi:putative sigma-54 modulation protein